MEELTRLDKLLIAQSILKELKIKISPKLTQEIKYEMIPELRKENQENVSGDIVKKKKGNHLVIIDSRGVEISVNRNPFSYIYALKKAGVENVRNLNLHFSNGYPIIQYSTQGSPGKKYKQIEDNYYAYNITSASNIKPILDKINKELNLGWEISII